MKPKTEDIPKMTERLLIPFRGIELELVLQTARALYYRDCLDEGGEQVCNDPFGITEPETRQGWVYYYNFTLKAINQLREDGFLGNDFIDEDE